MSVGITKINARTATGPGNRTLDGNSMLSQPRPPGRKALGGNAKANMHRPRTIMGRDSSKRHNRTVRITPAKKQKKDLLLTGRQSAKTVIRCHDAVTKKRLIESARPWQVGHIQTSFQNCARKRGSMFTHGTGSVVA